MRSWNTLPSKLPAQIAFFSLLFFGTMIFWHWEAMLISNLATRIISLPFKDIPELVSNTKFRIILIPGTSFEDTFKTSTDQNWQVAWTDRVQPHLEEHEDLAMEEFVQKVAIEVGSALYDNYFAVM